ncbi:ribosome biogenesis protein SLX9-domain-containing protein [Zychaea mexicana]|uniref:ribosome biogenesis protein SLX9-domain-containing protein n=1 Tax=Zychaea mexicana TaxID=64656 RepID=UPI0022FDED4D|nr:ribosome biogenesis protein SLX9-domain-containing protein [Zychaea mexicana]KAI9497356.1 ribosome biogenesis protein SLX9-domain-containing protein [Zychaea mexicana]
MPKAQKSRGLKKTTTPIAKKDDTTSAPAASVDTKDQKRKQRHDAWLEKLDRAHAQRKRAAKKSKNLQTDLTEFHDILDTIETKDTKKDRPAAIPTNKFQTNKSKRKAEMQEIVRFQKVMQLPAFQQNPLAAIRQHVQNTYGSSNNA